MNLRMLNNGKRICLELYTKYIINYKNYQTKKNLKMWWKKYEKFVCKKKGRKEEVEIRLAEVLFITI